MPTYQARAAYGQCQGMCRLQLPTAGSRRQSAGRRRYSSSSTLRPERRLSRLFFRIFRHAISDLLFSIGHGRRDYVRPARPLAQIDGAAAITAERKFGVAALHHFLADGAAKFQIGLARHSEIFQIPALPKRLSSRAKRLQNSSHQVIVMRFGNLAAIKLARRKLFVFRKIVHEYLPVDFRSMHRGAAFHEKIRLLGISLEQ